MATLTQIRNKANTRLTDFWQLLQTKQDVYFIKHGKFFQLLVTSDVVDGVDTTFVVQHPSDEKNLTDVDFTYASPIPFSISIDEWVGDTIGYSVTATFTLLDGTKYQRTRDSFNNDTNWYEYIELW
jgi:hypothetical protein